MATAGSPAAANAMEEKDRTIAFDTTNVGAAKEVYATNAIKTSKYTPQNFLPKNLLEQLHKFGNVYFLCISVVMFLGEKTPLYVGTIKSFSTLGLLMAMMSITAAMALNDDLRRKKADKEINEANATVVEPTGPKPKAWQDVKVGDVLLIKKDEEFPADLVPFYCSGEDGNCYVSTANLDGETNLKLKNAPEKTQKALGKEGISVSNVDKALSKLKVSVKAEKPSANIHDFSGSVDVQAGGSDSLGPKQLLMRGTVLRNTNFCIGIVVYTGADTRMVRNSRPSPMKQSNLEKVTNNAMIIILGVQGLLAVVGGVLHTSMSSSMDSHWYLEKPVITLPEGVGWWLTFFTLFSNLMPISLYPTVEFCNAFQSYFINNDRNMFYKQKEKNFNGGVGFAAKARSSNLVQELGQVSFIFSDKTGTLTQNDMELRRLSIGDISYGTFEVGGAPGFNGAKDLQKNRSDREKGKVINDFLEALAVSHTVMATPSKTGSPKPSYEAESPDEFALVDGAADLGWMFTERRGTELKVKVDGKENTYTVLATNAFNSTRKRMSVVVQKNKNEYLLLVKGADNVMLERISSTAKPDTLKKHLTEFSVEGLRTLVIASKQLKEADVKEFQKKYDEAQRMTAGRDAALDKAAEDIEKDLTILGATAIEDKLQSGVGETIEKIRKAEIKLWVLTGDKLETARNIGFSTKVLANDMKICIVDDSGEEPGSILPGKLDDVHKFLLADPNKFPFTKRAMMVTGSALGKIFEKPEADQQQFLAAAQMCAVLIACRVSPRQKAQMVELVRKFDKSLPITLAIGDGANDVPMIQAAHVGIGIAGVEGRQAVNNSDFAIAQFRFLQELLFDHGRSNYRRACTFTLFTFWRNMVQVLMMAMYTAVSGFSGTALFEDWIRLSFNFLCTLPILAVGCMDEDVDKDKILEASDAPRLYDYGRLNKDLNAQKTLATVGSAVAHSLLLGGLTVVAFNGFDAHGSGDYYTFGTIAYTVLLIDVNLQALFRANTFNKYTVGSVVASFIMYGCWLLFYPMTKFVSNILSPNMYMVPQHMVCSVYFWILCVSAPILSLMMDASIGWVSSMLPDEWQEDMTKIANAIQGSSPHGSQSSGSTPLLGNSNVVYDRVPDEEAAGGQHRNDRYQGDKFDQQEDGKVINLDELAQRKLKTRRLPISGRAGVVYGGFLSAAVLLALGGITRKYSQDAAQLHVTYAHNPDGETFLEAPWKNPGMGTHANELVTAENCLNKQEGSGVKCEKTVKLEFPMTNPWIFYAVGPFYQSYSAYMKSEVVPELYGRDVPDALREAMCVPSTRETVENGKTVQIIPCGMKATSVFNDTFEIEKGGAPIVIDRKISAWKSDVERYDNPSNYLDEEDASWLYERYEDDVIDKTKGVKSEHFADWMRPSAFPRVWNRYGKLNEKFEKGDELTISIDLNYPMSSVPGGWKAVVLTELNSFGGRHDGLSTFLLFGGGASLVMAGIALVAAPKQPRIQS